MVTTTSQERLAGTSLLEKVPLCPLSALQPHLVTLQQTAFLPRGTAPSAV